MMQELEKILEEIKKILEDNKVSELNSDGTIDKYVIDAKLAWDYIKDIIRKHMNDRWIPVEDERLWNILFEEACVEGEQAMRIYNRLKETFGGERSDMDGKL